MSGSTRPIQDAINAVNDATNRGTTVDLSSLESYFPIMQRLYDSVHPNYDSTTRGSIDALSKKYSETLRKLLPLAEAITVAHSKLQAGTIFGVHNDPSLKPLAIQLCIARVLLHASNICLVAGATSLKHFVENKINYASKGYLSQQELLKMLNLVDFTIDLLIHVNGISANATRLFTPNQFPEPEFVLGGVVESLGSLLDDYHSPIIRTLNLLDVYANTLPNSKVKELHTLPRPAKLTDEDVSAALVKLAALFTMTTNCPVYTVPILHYGRYSSLLVVVEEDSKQLRAMCTKTWIAQVEDDVIAKPFLGLLASWDEIRREKGEMKKKTVEHKAPIICLALIRTLGHTPLEKHKKTVESFSAPKASKIMESVGLKMLEYSKSSVHKAGEERLDICTAGATLLAFRIYVMAKKYSLVEESVDLPEPVDLLEAVSTLSLAWIEVAHCVVSNKEGSFHQYTLAQLAVGALHQTMVTVERFINQIKPSSSLSKQTFIAIFKAHEAIATIIATAGCIFATYVNDMDFIDTKKFLFDVLVHAFGLHRSLGELTNINVAVNRYPKSDAVCEAGLKAVEAECKALLWCWRISPKEILDLSKRCPNSPIPPFTVDDFRHPTESLPANLHSVLFELFKGSLYSCTFYGSMPVDPSSKLARKVGATALKAFYALASKLHEDWKLFAPYVDYSSIELASYFSIPGILRDPNPAMPYEEPNSVFTCAIVPILASPEPWLEKGVNAKLDPMFGLLPMPPQALRYMKLSKRAYDDAMKDVVEGGEVQKQRAVARARAMSMLQCSYVGCRSIMLPDQKSKLCSACKTAKYCSEKCLKADWKKNHKVACKAIAASRS